MLESEKAENLTSLPDVSEVEIFATTDFLAIIIGFETSIVVMDSSFFEIASFEFISATGIDVVFFGVSEIE